MALLALTLLFTGFAAAQDPAPLQDRQLLLRRYPPAEVLKERVAVPRGLAVVIGISSYKSLEREQWLSYAEKDAENVYATLIDGAAGNFEFENVRKLIGPAATLANIRDTLENWLPGKAQEVDRVVVFFVGHGVVDAKGRGYLAPYDVDTAAIDATAYPMDRLGDILSNRVRSRLKVLLLDACHAGKVTIDSNSQRVNATVRDLPQGFLTLASSRAAERSFEDPKLAGGNGVFSYFLVQGWKGEADISPSDGIVTADELVDYVKREVRAYAKSRGAQQTPIEFGDFPDDLVLGFSPNRRGRIAQSLPALVNGALIVETNLDNVEVFVDGAPRGSVKPGEPISIPGLSAGTHSVRGSRAGYEPVTLEVTVTPGNSQTVTLRLLHQRVTKPQAQALYDEGETLWRRSSASPSALRNAAALFSRALKEDPEFAAAALGLCRVQQAQDETANAIKACAKAVAMSESSSEARASYAVLLMETDDYSKAVRELQSAALMDPTNSFVQSLLAEALYLADRPRESEGAADRALTLDPSSAQAYLLRAESLRAQNRLEEAEEDYLRCLKLQEFGSSALRKVAFWSVGYGITKHRSGRQALYRNHVAQANFGLCACEMGRQNYARAIRFCNRVLSTEKSDTETFLLLSETYTGMFNRENRREYLVQVKQNLEAVLRINPHAEKAAEVKDKLRDVAELLSSVH